MYAMAGGEVGGCANTCQPNSFEDESAAPDRVKEGSAQALSFWENPRLSLSPLGASSHALLQSSGQCSISLVMPRVRLP